MKKLLVVFLSLTLIFAFAACSEQAEPAAEGLAAIPVGGGLPDLPVVGEAYGLYSPIEDDDAYCDSDELQADYYAAENCDIPYIAVYRWNKDGQGLKEIASELSKELGDGYYQLFDDETVGEVAFYCFGTEGLSNMAEGYYYVNATVSADGDDFVLVDFFYATEEIALGESGQYLYLPRGSQPVADADALADSNIFNGVYDESYGMPEIYVDLLQDYQTTAQIWSAVYPEGIPVTEEEFAAWQESGWDEAATIAFYEKMGAGDIIVFFGESNGCSYKNVYNTFDGVEIADTFITTDSGVFLVGLSGSEDPFPAYTNAILNSLHNK